MIRACAASPALDDASRRAVAWAVEHHPTLSPPRRRAWRLLLRSRAGVAPGHESGWYSVADRVKRGDIDRGVRASVLDEFRPRLRVQAPFRGLPPSTDPEQERLDGFIWADFAVPENVDVREVLAAWPTDASHAFGLLQAADHALTDALADADEAGFLDGLDAASHDVTSIVCHDENTLGGGFYPLVRLVADLWTRVSSRDPVRAKSVAAPWAMSPHLLHRRLHLFALASPAFSPAEVAAVLGGLDDETVWLNDAGRELMHLLLARWPELEGPSRSELERRLRAGPPRSLAADPRRDEAAWVAVSDYMVFRVLGRLAAAGAALEPASAEALASIRARHPDLDSGSVASDDAGARPEVMRGPLGDTERLLGVADDGLVEEALRLQRTEFRQSDVWAQLCTSDPGRAVRGVKLAPEADRWSPAVLVPLLSATGSKAASGSRDEVAGLLTAIPPEALGGLRRAAAFWLREHAGVWSPESDEPPEAFLRIWDRLADATFAEAGHDTAPPGDASLNRALNSAGGDLAAALLARLRARRPVEDAGLDAALGSRLTRIAEAGQAEGVYGRLILYNALAYLERVDHAWAAEHLVTRFAWDHPEAPVAWPAFDASAQGGATVRPRLCNALKPALLEAFRRHELVDRGARGLSHLLVRTFLEQRRTPSNGFSITAQEVRAALAAGPSAVRHDVSWRLLQTMKGGDQAEREERWRTLVRPLFDAVWPLDAASRDETSSRALATMTLQCGALVPDAVGAVRDVLVPCAMHSVKLTLHMDPRREEALRQHPGAFLRLLDAMVGGGVARVPVDLAEILDACVAADPAVRHDPAFDRLQGLRRRVQS